MSIPASRIVTINPAVVSTGGNPLALNGLFLTENLQMPAGQVYGFVSALAVSKFFGPASAEAALATIYFNGYDNSTVKPGAMLFAPYNVAARSGYLQSGSLANLTLTQLKALTGTLTISLDGTAETSSTINLSGATSFSNAATIIAAAFTTPPVVAWNAVTSSYSFTSNTTGANSSLSFATGSLATPLNLTSAGGAFLSPGAVADTPATAMANAVAVSQNWATMVPLFEPVLADKENFAIWFNGQNNRYCYLAWDTDAQSIVQNTTEAFGYVAKQLAYDGVACISGEPGQGSPLNVATFVAGAVASINFSQTNGRITLAFRSQSGLSASCVTDQNAQNLLANGYSFYGAYATANSNFTFFYNGQMPGKFDWIDSMMNEIYLNAQLQLADLNLLISVGDIPYTPSGYGCCEPPNKIQSPRRLPLALSVLASLSAAKRKLRSIRLRGWMRPRRFRTTVTTFRFLIPVQPCGHCAELLFKLLVR